MSRTPGTVRPLLALLSLGTLAAGGCAPTLESAPPVTIEEPCRLPGLDEELRCGSLIVPENRERPEKRTIELFYAVLPATGDGPKEEPMLVFQGGPGQAASEKAAFYAQFLTKLRDRREIVLLDQRGTGRSNPLDWQPGSNELLIAPDEYIPKSWTDAARTHLAAHHDLTRYSSFDAIEDIEALRRALGHDRLNIYGTSYGSRVALLYLKRYPERVRSAVIKGIVPLSAVVGRDYARDSQAALEMVFQDCANDPDCGAAFPELKQDFEAALVRLEREPAVVAVQEPLDETTVELTLTRGAFGLVTRTLLYSPASRAQLPQLIAGAAAGEFTPWAQIFVRMRAGLSRELYLGMLMAVLASEDCPRMAPDDAAIDARGTFLGNIFPEQISAMCQGWPMRPIPDESWLPETRTPPVLLISGRLDPATPPDNGHEVKQSLPNALHVVYPDAGHPAFNVPGLDSLIGEFVSRGTVEDLDLSAIEQSEPIQFAGID